MNELAKLQQELADMQESLQVYLQNNLQQQLSSYYRLGLKEPFKDCWLKMEELGEALKEMNELLASKKENQTVAAA